MRPDSPQFVPENDQTSASEEEGREFTSNFEGKLAAAAPEVVALTPTIKVMSYYRPDRQAQLRAFKFLVEKGETLCQPPSTSECRRRTRNKKA